MKKKVLFSIFVPEFKYSNRNSAVANYLNTLIASLDLSQFSIETIPVVKGEKKTEAFSPESVYKNKSIKNILRKLSLKTYNSIVDYKYFKSQKQLASNSVFVKPDLVIEFLTSGSSYGLKIKEQTNAKLVIIFDSPLLEQYQEMRKAGTFYDSFIAQEEKLSVEHADLIFCYSISVKEYILKNFKVNSPIIVMPCIVWKYNLKIATPEESRPVIGFIGSFLKWHKVALLVNAFEKINAKAPTVKLKLIGYGEEWHRIKEMVEKSSASASIEMPGYLSDEELSTERSTFTIGVMPGSNWYGSPLKLFEYAQAGIPIIAPETETVKDFFEENIDALFIDNECALESLEDKLKELLSDKKKREFLVSNALNKMNSVFSKQTQMSLFNQHILDCSKISIKN